MKRLFAAVVLIMTIAGCDDSSNPGTFVVPSDLSVEVDVSNDGSGLVSVTAMATNAFRYELHPGDGNQKVISSSGDLTYKYSESGTYQMEIRALANSSEFPSQITEINIEVTPVDMGPVIPETGYTTPLSYAGMDLIWQDEFEGTSLDETNWNYEIGTGTNGWGNNELQYYRQENTTVTDDVLIIEAKKEAFGGSAYTSSRLTTQGKFDFQYGRVDIRAALPKGQGIWPALWMLGANFGSVGWPASGEIDIMELIGGGEGRDDTVYGTIHWDDAGTKADFGGNTQLASGTFNDQFYVFTIIWDADEIKWYVDDQLYHTADISPAGLSEFQADFFFIFNVAVGGNWPGSPNSSTVFPQRMIVDYVRVFQDE